MDLNKLKTLIDLVSESNITELEVTEGDERIKIIKNGSNNNNSNNNSNGNSSNNNSNNNNINALNTATATAPAQAASVVYTTAPITSTQAPATALAAPAPAEGKVIKSPMVGTFYAASGPEKPDFVSVGTAVKSNQTVCIIEAMKLLNEIEAGLEGTVIEILVKNGTPVEFGQPLFIVA